MRNRFHLRSKLRTRTSLVVPRFFVWQRRRWSTRMSCSTSNFLHCILMSQTSNGVFAM
ncbi:hypothetical protein RchiOBHm_Chr3g0489141 [Rosa chinensis]|uniref:Uncharacterized protein n=1 Tax=Rosa chinensis TaxID=74649 RepID=A0A2P6RFY7_ROSCH|nr:hypothetical protein RchiOBHm_Chr3g0489141 [Rosa chinensis]